MPLVESKFTFKQIALESKWTELPKGQTKRSTTQLTNSKLMINRYNRQHDDKDFSSWWGEGEGGESLAIHLHHSQGKIQEV